MRVGHGYDAHRLVEGRPLILGGVTIPYALGLAGHSDADALIHALCDAILGAMGEGDIGLYFPDTDPVFKDISSRILLRKTIGLMAENDYMIGNADVTILAQEPKMMPYIQPMRELLAADMNASIADINIKATTTEKMGFVGAGEGIAVHAVVLLNEC